MRRRDFIAGLGATGAWPPAARAQQTAVPVIGFMHPGSPDAQMHRLAGLRDGLKEAGYVEGQNVAIEYRWAHDQIERLPALAVDLVHRRVAVILVTGGPGTAFAAKAATSSIPIVFASGFDPVKLGLVPSFNRPAGNVTGVTVISTELGGKRLDVLLQCVPEVMTVGYLAGGGPRYGEQEVRDTVAAAHARGRQIVVLQTHSERDFDTAFATLVERKVGALVVGAYPLFSSHLDKLVALAAQHQIPAIYQDRDLAAAGGLMSYGPATGTPFAWVESTSGRFSKAPSPPICQYNRPPNSSWSSTSKPPRRSAFKSHRRCSPSPTR
jgi:putative ABC transport system substrate-binding protein